MKLRVLILGGYGTFGGRLAQLLADDPRITLLIAGRSRARAAEFCAMLLVGSDCAPFVFDRDATVTDQLRRATPSIVVDATGPFQSYGAEPYRVAEASIVLGIDYLDLADGSAFVDGIAQFDAAARERGVFVLSGVSSCPVLTVAVVRRLAEGMARVDAIMAGIAPSPYAVVGRNVIRSIASYAGRQVTLRRNGHPVTRYALTETMRYTISPPGRLPLLSRRFSLVDVPDLRVLRALWPDLRDVWFGAGIVPEVMQRALNLMASGVRLRLVRSLSPFAGLFHRVINVLRWGEHRGGMFVVLLGVGTDGARRERSWHLLAEGDDGPLIPSMAAATIVRQCLEGRRPASGARASIAEVNLDDYDRLFARRTIYTGFRDMASDEAAWPLYRRLLGAAWAELPPALQAMHDVRGDITVHGEAAVERGTGTLARAIAAVFRLPIGGTGVPVSVTFTLRDRAEVWRRNFGGRSFSSVQVEGHGRSARLVVERFGPFRFGLAIVVEAGGLNLIVRNWSILGLPLPMWLAPVGKAYEFAADGVFHFHVEIGHRLTGLIVHYRGWLAAPSCDDSVSSGR